MAKLKAGDKVNCLIKNNTIVAAYESNFDEEKTFEILSTDSRGYFIYVPDYFNLKGTSLIDQSVMKSLRIDKKFLDSQLFYITDTSVFKIYSILDGCFCCKCHEFYNYASPNQEDGTLICFTCNKYPYYRTRLDE